MQEIENINYKHRIQSIDFLRGIVIIIMALDHVRDFFGAAHFDPLDLSQTSVALFYTRWITNVCAPTFVFLTGMSAYLNSLKSTKKELSLFLIKRGLFIILLEITFISFAWSFKPFEIIDLQVMWILGSSMIILAGLIWLPRKIILPCSLIVMFCHNLLDDYKPLSHGFFTSLWPYLHVSSEMKWHQMTIYISYPLLPWPALMAFGYCLGTWMKQSVAVRSKKFWLLGMSCLVLFFILRWINLYGDHLHWQSQSRGAIFTTLSFINTTKYPPSLFYILQTIGIVTCLWPLWEKYRGAGKNIILTFGKVAMFFYLIHILLIHTLADIYSRILFRVGSDWVWFSQNTIPFPAAYHFSLLRVYLVWLGILFVTYPLCLKYRKYKQAHDYHWLKYI